MRRISYFAAFLTLCLAAQSHAQETASNQVLVELKTNGVTRNPATFGRDLPGATLKKVFSSTGWAKVELPAGETVTAASLARVSASLGGARVIANTRRHYHATPNDNNYSAQWAYPKIAAPRAWDLTTGSSSVVVGVIDSGIAATHGDLAANMWINPGESGSGKAANKFDDDGNGYVDDAYGINAIDSAEASNIGDDVGHGSHVAGIIGAVGNNSRGGTGVNWNVKLMALKFIDASGNGYDADAIECIEYAIAQKKKGVNLRVLNCSWGGPDDNPALKAAFDAAGEAGILMVCSAGNGGSDSVGDNTDVTPEYPASFTTPAVIAVAASDQSDNRAAFSNYGATSVDIAAPGVLILSSASGGGVAYMTGTSMAAPFVSGAAALILSKENGLSVTQLKSRILDTAERLPQWSGLSVTGGRLNLNRAVRNSIYSISGNVFRNAVTNPKLPLVGARIYANDALVTSTDENGNYSISSIAAGTYQISVKLGGFSFSPQSVTLPNTTGAAAPNAVRNFEGSALGTIYNVSGYAYNTTGAPAAGIKIYWNGLAVPVATTDSLGYYIVRQRTAGTFTLQATGADLDWTPTPASVTLPSTTGTNKPQGTVNFNGKLPDKTPPTVTITQPAANATIKGTSYTAKGTATDPSGVASMHFVLYKFGSSGTQYYDWLGSAWTTNTSSDGIIKIVPVSGATTVNWELLLPNLAAGNYQLLVWGTDSKGNESTGAQDKSVNFTVSG